MAKEGGGWTWLEAAGAAFVTESGELAGDSSLRLPTFAAALGRLKQKGIQAKSTAGSGVLACLNAAYCLGDFTRFCAFCNT